MGRFLKSVAEALWEHYGEGISSLNIVVPNMRSRLFFADELSRIVDKPVWQPRFTTIDDLVTEASELHTIDPIRAVIELYKVYFEYNNEPLDNFYFWGEVLLNDFNQVDLYRINADMMFANVSDLQQMVDDYSYLTNEQKEVISHFWSSFGGNENFLDGEESVKRNFISVWGSLGKVYNDFRKRLRSVGVGYSGMLYRDVAEKIERGEQLNIPAGQYVIVGFNALSECEKTLFNTLQREFGAEFFWDTDDYYTKDEKQEAGRFLSDNIVRYPSPSYFHPDTDNFRQPKNITVVSAPSSSMQCKELATALASLPQPLGKETAIVLADENLLIPVLYSLPPSLENINITMGYPVRGTRAYMSIEQWFKEELPQNSEADISMLAENLIVYMRREADNMPASIGSYDRSLQMECFGVMAKAVHKLKNSLLDCGVELTTRLFATLVRRVLQRLRIPYSGEPLGGIQIMGILETRNLDFENVIVLSLNDDKLPATHNSATSFIPYNIRYGYGMPVAEHHDSIYAYYFYRLIQRAQNIELIYCASNDSDSTGEQSRYIYQLEYESPHKETIVHRDIGLNLNLPQSEGIAIEKDETVMARLSEYLVGGRRKLSPTSFNNYLSCPLKFYFHSVEHLKVPTDEIVEIDASIFGTILHGAMCRLYKPLRGIHNPSPQIQALINSNAVHLAIDDAIFEEIAKTPDEYSGEVLLVGETVAKYINNAILPYDAQLSGWTITDTEHPLDTNFEFGALAIRFGGIADRIDGLDDGTVRIVDYKTGKMTKDFVGIEKLFANDSVQKSGAIVQTFIYSMMMFHKEKRDVTPALYYVRSMNSPSYSPYIAPKNAPRQSYALHKDEFEERLREILTEIYNPCIPFVQCESKISCEFCDFAKICNRI